MKKKSKRKIHISCSKKHIISRINLFHSLGNIQKPYAWNHRINSASKIQQNNKLLCNTKHYNIQRGNIIIGSLNEYDKHENFHINSTILFTIPAFISSSFDTLETSFILPQSSFLLSIESSFTRQTSKNDPTVPLSILGNIPSRKFNS